MTSIRTIHAEPFHGAGQTYLLKDGITEYRVEDWWDRVYGASWMDATGNPAALQYAVRSATDGLPIDNDVVYGKVGSFGHIIHTSELAQIVPGGAR